MLILHRERENNVLYKSEYLITLLVMLLMLSFDVGS